MAEDERPVDGGQAILVKGGLSPPECPGDENEGSTGRDLSTKSPVRDQELHEEPVSCILLAGARYSAHLGYPIVEYTTYCSGLSGGLPARLRLYAAAFPYTSNDGHAHRVQPIWREIAASSLLTVHNGPGRFDLLHQLNEPLHPNVVYKLYLSVFSRELPVESESIFQAQVASHSTKFVQRDDVAYPSKITVELRESSEFERAIKSIKVYPSGSFSDYITAIHLSMKAPRRRKFVLNNLKHVLEMARPYHELELGRSRFFSSCADLVVFTEKMTRTGYMWKISLTDVSLRHGEIAACFATNEYRHRICRAI